MKKKNVYSVKFGATIESKVTEVHLVDVNSLWTTKNNTTSSGAVQ